MWKLTVLILLSVLLNACAGSFTRIPEADKSVKVTAAIAQFEREKVFVRIADWMEINFTAAAQPIVSADREEGRIVGAGQIKYPCAWAGCFGKGDWQVAFTMRVVIADGTVSTSFRDIRLLSPPVGTNPGMSSPVWSKRDMDAIRPRLLELNRSLISSLHAGG